MLQFAQSPTGNKSGRKHQFHLGKERSGRIDPSLYHDVGADPLKQEKGLHLSGSSKEGMNGILLPREDSYPGPLLPLV